MIILDSNVLSALMFPSADPAAIRWLDGQPRASVWTTSVTIFEIRFGIETMPPGRRQAATAASFDHWLGEIIQERVAYFDTSAAQYAAELAADRQRRGRPRELRDTMIAGIVLANHATLATRNVKHFEDIAKWVVNPWDAWQMTEDALKIDEAKTALNARAKASMREYLKSRTWPEKIASIERMNEAGRLAREGMRRTRKGRDQGKHL